MSARSLLVSFVVVGVVAIGGRQAAAQNPNQAFNGRIMASTKKFPATGKSPSAYTATVRKLSQTSFVEDKTDHTWVIWCAGFLKSPLNDVEYSLKVWDLSSKPQQLLVTYDMYNDERGQKTIVAKVKLDKKQVGVNKAVMLTIESKGKVLASSNPLKILGEGERYTGKVTFDEEEAAGKDKDDDDSAKKKDKK